MYKKILSLALVFVLSFSCFAISVSATSSIEDKCKEAYIEYWTKDHASTDEVQWFNGKLNYFGYLGEAGCHVFQAAAVPGSPVEPTDEIGDYRFTAHMCMSYCDTNPAGMYAYNGNDIMTLREAYDKGLVDLDLLYENTTKKYTMTKLSDEEILKNKCKAELEEEYGIEDISAEGDYISFAVKFENYTVFQWRFRNPMSAFCFSFVNGYWFDEGEIHGNYTLDNYGNVEPLEETASKGFIDIDEFFSELPETADMHLSGDVDGDKSVTVKDATLVQKFVAKYSDVVTELVNDPVRIAVADVDHSGGFEDPDWVNNRNEVTIKDATYIQKKVAKIFGEDDRPSFAYDHITIGFDRKDVREYTLEDFPEYEFEKIERWEALSFDYVTLTLYLKNPGEKNVIDAVNSLKYREGVEFSCVELVGLAYPD